MSSSEQPTWEERIAHLREAYADLQEKVGMGNITGKMGDVATEIAGLPGEIEQLRQRGYAFAGYLENKAKVLAEQWDEVRQQVRRAVNTEIERIQRQYDEIRDLWSKLEVQRSDEGRQRHFDQVKNAIDQVGGAIDAARSRIEGLYGHVPDNVGQTRRQIAQLNTYLDRADESSVAWGPTEALFMAVEAEWRKTGKGKEDPDGILYLTDQRLIFEQKEKVGGRFGFGGEKVQEKLFETPVGSISEVKAEDKGLFGGKDLIHLKLSSGDYAETTFEVKGGVDSKSYAQQLNRVITGDIEKERAIPIDEAAAEAVREAPTACTVCGATLPAITRGMTEVTCEYCGTVVRL
jgi:hypothetical protein